MNLLCTCIFFYCSSLHPFLSYIRNVFLPASSFPLIVAYYILLSLIVFILFYCCLREHLVTKCFLGFLWYLLLFCKPLVFMSGCSSRICVLLSTEDVLLPGLGCREQFPGALRGRDAQLMALSSILRAELSCFLSVGAMTSVQCYSEMMPNSLSFSTLALLKKSVLSFMVDDILHIYCDLIPSQWFLICQPCNYMFFTSLSTSVTVTRPEMRFDLLGPLSKSFLPVFYLKTIAVTIFFPSSPSFLSNIWTWFLKWAKNCSQTAQVMALLAASTALMLCSSAAPWRASSHAGMWTEQCSLSVLRWCLFSFESLWAWWRWQEKVGHE